MLVVLFFLKNVENGKQKLCTGQETDFKLFLVMFEKWKLCACQRIQDGRMAKMFFFDTVFDLKCSTG
jgi:hypothetical protein